MKTSEIFSRAQKLLWRGKTKEDTGHVRYICDVITHHPKLNPLLGDKEADRATTIIHDLIGQDQFSLKTWLITHKHATAIEIDNNPEKMQATRIAFLDHLIAHYKAKGD